MSSEASDIQVLERAIMDEARQEANQILASAEAKAEGIKHQAQARTDAQREEILQRAREEAEALHEHTVAAAQLEAQTLKLKRREQLLKHVFAAARRELASVPQRADYEQIAHHLVREAVEHMGAGDVLVRVDESTQQVLDEETLANLGQELGVHLRSGEPLAQGIGAVLETPDGHRRYDNRLETRLDRMQEALRTAVYQVLMGETP
jgi:vacuolar-type H+-ATPase subunit E/Vma4